MSDEQSPVIGARIEALRRALATADPALVCAYLFGSTALEARP
ncbi:hypothetical protein [uncultured Thiodictyon sp.]|nr:hypothetical protein [uncultured Thiodictyon sp.]